MDDDAGAGVPEWVVTYGDMMSLLLTFFIMLVSMSEIKDEGRVRAMMDAIRRVFGPTTGLAGVPGRSLQQTSMLHKRHSSGKTSQGDTKRASRKSDGRAGDQPTVRRINHGTVVTLGGPTLFDRTDQALSAAAKARLDTIAAVFAHRTGKLVIRGHASPEPLTFERGRSRYGFDVHDHWDLSYARARAVLEYLVERGIDRQRLVVTAAAETEPRIRTRRSDTQKLNRRVDVFLGDAYITRP